MARKEVKKSSVLEKFTTHAEENKEGKDGAAPVTPTKERKLTNDEPKIEASKTMKAQHVPWIDSSKAQELLVSPNMNTEVIRLPNAVKVNQSVLQKTKEVKSDLLKSPSLFLRDSSAKDIVGSLLYCECGNSCDGESTVCSTCLKSKETIENTGYLYLKAKSTKLKRYWYILLNKELYCKARQNYLNRLQE